MGAEVLGCESGDGGTGLVEWWQRYWPVRMGAEVLGCESGDGGTGLGDWGQ